MRSPSGYRCGGTGYACLVELERALFLVQLRMRICSPHSAAGEGTNARLITTTTLEPAALGNRNNQYPGLDAKEVFNDQHRHRGA